MDTREQRALRFPDYVSVVEEKCDHGDYCLHEAPGAICIERKNPEDAISSILTDTARDNFVSRVERARAAGVPYIVVVETTPDQIRARRYFSRANPESVLGRYDSLLARGVPVLAANDRAHASRIITDLLVRRAKQIGLMPPK